MGSITSVPSYLKTIGLTTSTSGERLLIGFIGALYFVGVMLGALISGWLSDKVGRRRALICASVWGCIIVPIFAASQNLGWVISTRILNGVATGAFDSIGLNWCAETVSHKKRGRSIGFQLCSAAVGEYAESDPGRAKAFGNGALVLTLLWGAQYGLTFCESSVSTMNTTLGTNKSCSVVFIHLSFRDLPSPVSSQRQLCWHRWIRYRFVPGKHGQHIYIQCYRLGDDVFTLRDKLHGRCNLLLFYAGNS